MGKSLKTELLENLAVFSAILDVLSVDVSSLYQMTGYRSPNAQRLESLILESKRGLSNLKQLIEKEREMDFDSKENKIPEPEKAKAPKQEPKKEEKKSAEAPKPAPKKTDEPALDSFGLSLEVPENIREEMHKVLLALNNVANYAMDQITISNRVFSRYIAGLYNIKPEDIFKDMEKESLILQKMHEREDSISDADTVGGESENGK